jgi:hypothetical protein
MANGTGSIVSKVKERPIMTVLTTITIVGAALGTLITYTERYDTGHTSQAELEEVVQAASAARRQIEAQVESGIIKSTCESLAIRIAIIEQQIWQMKQSGGDGERLVEKERELSDLVAKYNSLTCSSLLR